MGGCDALVCEQAGKSSDGEHHTGQISARVTAIAGTERERIGCYS